MKINRYLKKAEEAFEQNNLIKALNLYKRVDEGLERVRQLR